MISRGPVTQPRWQLGHFLGTWPRLLGTTFFVAVLLAIASRQKLSDIVATSLAWIWIPVVILVLISGRFGSSKHRLMNRPPAFHWRLFFGGPRRVFGSILVVCSIGNLLTGNPLQGLFLGALFVLLVMGKRAKRLPKLMRKPF